MAVVALGRPQKPGRLKKRSEFLAVAAANRRWTAPGLVLQALRIPADAKPSEPPIRVGFTATRKIGNAVARNRARRRLRAAAAEVMRWDSRSPPRPADLVLVARPGTIGRRYADLKSDLETALGRLGIIGR